MNLVKDSLTIDEAFSLVVTSFHLGEVVSYYHGNDKMRKNLKKKRYDLGENEKLDKSIKELLDGYINPLITLIKDEEILGKYKKQLREFFENFDKKMEVFNAIFPFKEIQKEVLIYFISYKALEIYYDKTNLNHEEYKEGNKKRIRYGVMNALPVDFDNISNSFKGLLKNFEGEGEELFPKDENLENWMKSGGATISSKLILENFEYCPAKIDFYVNCFFKRPQWRIYNKLMEDKKLRVLLPALLSSLKRIRETQFSEEEFIDICFEILTEEIGKNLGASIKKIEKAKEHFNLIIKITKEIIGKPKVMLRILEPTMNIIDMHRFKENICLDKLSANEIHRELIKIHQLYGELKGNYSQEKHKELYDTVKGYKNTENKYQKKYFNYFICDSLKVIDKNIEKYKGPSKQSLERFKEKLEKIKVGRFNDDKWDGRVVSYLDYYYWTPEKDKLDISPNLLENIYTLKEFSKDEVIDNTKNSLESSSKILKNIMKETYEK